MNPDDITAAAGEGAAHTFTLALRAPPWHLGAEPSEAELQAIDRCYQIAKQMGLIDRLRDMRALQQQINEGPKLGEIG